MTWKSVTHDFQARSSEDCSIYDAEISCSPTRFSGELKRNSLFTAILSLHSTFRMYPAYN